MPCHVAGGRVVSIGITPWGTVEKRHELVGKKMDVPFHSVAQPRSVKSWHMKIVSPPVGQGSHSVSCRMVLHETLKFSSPLHPAWSLILADIDRNGNCFMSVRVPPIRACSLSAFSFARSLAVAGCSGSGFDSDMHSQLRDFTHNDVIVDSSKKSACLF